MSDPILLETTGTIATIIFNRPERRNAITFAMWNDLQRAQMAADRDRVQGLPERVVVALAHR